MIWIEWWGRSNWKESGLDTLNAFVNRRKDWLWRLRTSAVSIIWFFVKKPKLAIWRLDLYSLHNLISSQA